MLQNIKCVSPRAISQAFVVYCIYEPNVINVSHVPSEKERVVLEARCLEERADALRS